MENSSVEDTNFNRNAIQFNGFLMDLSIPKIMGILNVTEDSFFEGSRLKTDSELLNRAEQHLSEGATFLDLGGVSTRPNARLVEEQEELKRIEMALKILKKEFPTAYFSVDTFRGTVAQVAVDEGASIINDISGFQFDESLLDVIARNNIAYLLMHLEGTFQTMHQTHQKGDVVERVCNYFSEKLEILNGKGVSNIILDPGFGFSKTLEENYELLHRMEALQQFKRPLLVGVSRKSMIYKKLNGTPEDSLNGTTVLNTVAAMKGANIFRVHDVKACREMIDLLF
jgi:dihydropteroate synthase